MKTESDKFLVRDTFAYCNVCEQVTWHSFFGRCMGCILTHISEEHFMQDAQVRKEYCPQCNTAKLHVTNNNGFKVCIHCWLHDHPHPIQVKPKESNRRLEVL